MGADPTTPRPGTRLVRFSEELAEALFTRDHEGNLLRLQWGEPDEDGVYTPTLRVDRSDNPFIRLPGWITRRLS